MIGQLNRGYDWIKVACIADVVVIGYLEFLEILSEFVFVWIKKMIEILLLI